MDDKLTKPSAPSFPTEGGSLRGHLIKGASGSFIIQVGFAGLAFLNSAILARLLGTAGFGAYAGSLAWMSLLLIPAVMGFDTLLVRDVAIYRGKQEWGKLRGLLRFTMRTAMIVSILCAALFIAIAYWGFAEPDKQPLRNTLYIAALLLPITVIATLTAAAMRGLERVVLANLPGLIFRPVLILLGILLLFFLWPESLTAPMAMLINVVAATAALLIGFIWLRKNISSYTTNVQPEYHVKPWLMVALPMLIFGGSQTVLGQTDMAMLVVMRGTEETGLYAAASRLSYLLIYGSIATGITLAPTMARLYEAGEKERLQNIITKAARISFFVVLPFGLALIFFGRWFMGIFGAEFITGWPILALLATGQLAGVAMGAGPLLLTMTGHERIAAVVFAAVAMSNVALNAILIPEYGAVGAAAASVASLIVVKLAFMFYAAARTGLDVSILGRRINSIHNNIN